MRTLAGFGLAAASVALVYAAVQAQAKDEKSVADRVFEIRTYYAAPGKMDALHARFRDHTLKLFAKHGITNIAYWKPTDAADAEKKMVYVLAYPSRAAADKSWEAFKNDPEWKKARDASEVNGKLVDKVESTYLAPTDYSPMK